MREPLYKIYSFRAKRKVLRGYKTTLPTLEKSISELQIGMSDSEFKKNRFPQYFNSMLFFRIAIKDILVIHKELLLTKNKEVQNIHARTLALHLYEFAQDFQKLNGKDFRRELATIPQSDEILRKFDLLKHHFHTIKPHYEQLLKDIRHHTIAHKDNDALLLNSKINNIDHLKIVEIETAAFLLFALYDKFLKDAGGNFVKYQAEIIKMPYLNDIEE